MARHQEVVAEKSSPGGKSGAAMRASGTSDPRWVPAPEKRPWLLASLAILYGLWLILLAWIAARAG